MQYTIRWIVKIRMNENSVSTDSETDLDIMNIIMETNIHDSIY